MVGGIVNNRRKMKNLKNLFLLSQGILFLFVILFCQDDSASMDKVNSADMNKYLSNIKEIIQKLIQKKKELQKKRKARENKSTIRKQLYQQKLSLPPVHRPKKIEIGGKQEKKGGYTASLSKDKISPAVTFSLAIKIKILLSEKPFLSPFKFSSIKKYMGQSRKSEGNSGNNKEGNSENRPNWEPDPQVEFAENIKEYLWEVFTKARTFWRLVKEILTDVINEGLYDEFLKKYCYTGSNLVIRTRDFKIEPPTLDEIFFLERFNIMEQIKKDGYAIYSNSKKWMVIEAWETTLLKNFTAKGKELVSKPDVCLSLYKIDRFFMRNDLIEMINQCISAHDECKKRNKGTFIIIVDNRIKEYFKMLNRILPVLMEVAVFTKYRGNVRSVNVNNNDSLLSLLYGLLWEKKFLHFFAGISVINKLGAPFKSCDEKKVKDSILSFTEKFAGDLSKLFFCDDIYCAMSSVGAVDTIIEGVFRIYTRAKSEKQRPGNISLTNITNKIEQDIARFITVQKELVNQYNKLDGVTKICILSKLVRGKIEANSVSDEIKRKIYHGIIDELLMMLDKNNITPLMLLATTNTINYSEIITFRMCNEVFFDEFGFSANDRIKRLNMYLEYLKRLDILIATSEIRYVLLKCLGEVKEPMEDVTIRCGEWRAKLVKDIIEKGDILSIIKEFNGEDRYKTLEDVLKKIYTNISHLSISELDTFFALLKSTLGDKKYTEIIDGPQQCCGECRNNSICLGEHTSICNILIGSDFVTPVDIGELKSICPNTGITRCIFDPTLPQTPCVLCDDGSSVDCNRWALFDGTCPSSACGVSWNNYRNTLLANFNGNNFCQLIDQFINCCKNCLECDKTDQWCTQSFPAKNLRNEYLAEVKRKTGDGVFNIILKRINEFHMKPPFSDDVLKMIERNFAAFGICK